MAGTMKVKDAMTPNPKVIWLTESLVDAAELMWENDCGVLPVIKDGSKVIGLITDRDICMATAMRQTNPSGVSVEEVMTGQVYSVNPEDDVAQALQTMQDHKIRRLPVVNAQGELEGILSMNDIVLRATESNGMSAQVDYAQAWTVRLRKLAAGAGQPANSHEVIVLTKIGPLL
jgi:CBS domain-containing protein